MVSQCLSALGTGPQESTVHGVSEGCCKKQQYKTSRTLLGFQASVAECLLS